MHCFIIAAMTVDGFIARDQTQNSTYWTGPEDTAWFSQRSKQAGVVVMGRATYETIGRSLPGRVTIVYSRSKYENVVADQTVFEKNRVYYTQAKPEALLQQLEDLGFEEVAISGGSSIYTLFLQAGVVDTLYLTIEPQLFGQGVCLFNQPLEKDLKLAAVKRLSPQTLLLTYSVRGKLPTMIDGHPELDVADYDRHNLKSVLRTNLNHFTRRQQIKGKLIVFDGADGAGKATQVKLLRKYFKEHKLKHQSIAFPRYKTSFHGRLVGRFLKGEFGGNREVSPYLASLAFALDRLTARDEMMEWLREGNLVVADRYVSSTIAHQGSKLSADKCEEFIDWVYEMEYKEHKLPKEDMVIFLYVPAEISQQLLEKKSADKNNNGQKDEAEKDPQHQIDTIKMYQRMVKKFPHWQMIKCVNNKGELLTRGEIHHRILRLLQKKKILE